MLTPQTADSLMSDITKLITAQSASGYVLLDGALCPAKSTVWLHQTPAVIVAPHSRPHADSLALPYLIEIPSLGRAAQRELVHLACETSGVTWVGSRLPLRPLAKALGERMEALLPQDMPVLLRLADARVLPQLHLVLDDVQRQCFFAVADIWCYLDRQHQLASLACGGGAASKFVPPLQLNAEQEAQLLRAAEPDAVLRLLKEQDECALMKIPSAERFGFVQKQMSLAARWGLNTPLDFALYCMLSLEYGDGFDESPDWRTKLVAVQAGETRLMNVLESLPTNRESQRCGLV